MKILNLYANLGGNRKLWGDEHEITSVELDPKIAEVYRDLWPNDTMIVADAHQFLLENFEDYDFIWSSPPCPTHSQLGRLRSFNKKENKAQYSPPKYPDMALYEEILLLKGYFKGKFCVENVIGWYEPLVTPIAFGGHYFWTNFYFPPYPMEPRGIGVKNENIKERAAKMGFDLSKYAGINKRLAIRDMTEPELGKHILDYSLKEEITSLFS